MISRWKFGNHGGGSREKFEREHHQVVANLAGGTEGGISAVAALPRPQSEWECVGERPTEECVVRGAGGGAVPPPRSTLHALRSYVTSPFSTAYRITSAVVLSFSFSISLVR